MNDEYRELFIMYRNEDEHSKLILDLKQPDDTRGAYVDNPYPVDGEKIWNVDKCKDIPWEYDGYIGVPITIMAKINRDVFEIIDTNTGFCGQYRIDGKKIFKRLILKRKKDAPLYEWYNTEDPLTEEDNIPFEEFIKKYTATDESKLKVLRENFKFWKLRNEYEKIEGIKILIL